MTARPSIVDAIIRGVLDYQASFYPRHKNIMGESRRF